MWGCIKFLFHYSCLASLYSSIRKEIGLDLFFPKELIDSMKVWSQNISIQFLPKVTG